MYTLNKIGMGDCLNNSFIQDSNKLIINITNRIKDIINQEERAKLNNYKSLTIFKLIKKGTEISQYLINPEITNKQKIGLAWWRLGIRKLKNWRGNSENNKCILCNEEEDDNEHLILKCKMLNEIRNKYFDKHFFHIYTITKNINYSNTKHIQKFGNFLFIVRELIKTEIKKHS